MMANSTKALSQTPADLLAYQSEQVRTEKFEPLGRLMKMSIGDSANYRPPERNKYLGRFGRFIDFRRMMLPLALSLDGSQLLVTAPLLRATCPKCGEQFLCGGAQAVCEQCLCAFSTAPAVGLPAVPDPTWESPAPSSDEVQMKVKRDPAKLRPPMIPVQLEDYCEQDSGKPALLERTNFMLFQPVVRMAFQPENAAGQLLASVGLISCTSGAGGYSPTFLVDYKTGECHFFGGRFVIAKKG